jgi:hypothetical protein
MFGFSIDVLFTDIGNFKTNKKLTDFMVDALFSCLSGQSLS